MKSSILTNLLLNKYLWKHFFKNLLVGVSIFTLLFTSQIGVLSTYWDKGPQTALADFDVDNGNGTTTSFDEQGNPTATTNTSTNNNDSSTGIGDNLREPPAIGDSNAQTISSGDKTQAGKVNFDPKTQAGSVDNPTQAGTVGKPTQAGPVGGPTQAGPLTPVTPEQPSTPSRPSQPSQPEAPSGPGPLGNPSNLSANCTNNTLNLSWNMGANSDSTMIRIDDMTISGWGGYANPQPGDTLIDFFHGSSFSRPADPGHSYQWWIHSAQGSTLSADIHGPNVTCPAAPPPPPPTQPPAPPAALTAVCIANKTVVMPFDTVTLTAQPVGGTGSFIFNWNTSANVLDSNGNVNNGLKVNGPSSINIFFTGAGGETPSVQVILGNQVVTAICPAITVNRPITPTPTLPPTVTPTPPQGAVNANLQCPQGFRQVVTGNTIQCTQVTTTTTTTVSNDNRSSATNTNVNNNTNTVNPTINVNPSFSQNVTQTSQPQVILAAVPVATTSAQVAGITVTTLPKTGLPIVAWGLFGLAPLGMRIRRYARGLKPNPNNPNFIWEEREYNK